MNQPSPLQHLALDDLAMGTNIDLNETASRSHSFKLHVNVCLEYIIRSIVFQLNHELSMETLTVLIF